MVTMVITVHSWFVLLRQQTVKRFLYNFISVQLINEIYLLANVTQSA